MLVSNNFSPQTSYENQTKKAITNKIVQEAMTEFFRAQLEIYFIEHNAEADRVMEQVLINKRSRETAEKARLNIKKKLPGNVALANRVQKFIDCRSKDKTRREVYIVEGDSAAGAIRTSRDAEFQGVMPVRGKILNCLKEDYPRIFKSDIIMDLIAGLPGDTVEGFEKSLRQAIALDPENITVHTLTLKRASRIVIEDQKENDYADVAAMLEKCHLLAEAGYRPYYLYRQKNTLQNLENVGWCKPGHEGYYNIYIMEEVQTILSAGAGGSTTLVADGGKRMQRIFNFKYPTEYIQRFDEVLERKKGVAVFYDHDLGTETSG